MKIKLLLALILVIFVLGLVLILNSKEKPVDSSRLLSTYEVDFQIAESFTFEEFEKLKQEDPQKAKQALIDYYQSIDKLRDIDLRRANQIMKRFNLEYYRERGE